MAFRVWLLIAAFSAGSYAYEEDDDASVQENDSKNLYLEIPALGNGFAFLYPSRVFSLKLDIGRQFGAVAEPIVGHGVIKGLGSTAGLYYRNGKNSNGLKDVFIDIERYGALHEFFYGYDRYVRTGPGLNLRFGHSAGVGMRSFSENGSEPDAKLDFGPTFRLHLDRAYPFKYN